MIFKLSFVMAGLAALGAVSAAEVEKRAAVSDTTILNYALTLEHLEAFFYKQALEKFSAEDFKKAGYPAYVRQRIVEIGAEESTHVATLTAALGNDATPAGTYAFPYETVSEFLAVSRILEGVGVSAYLGAAKYISDPAYLTVAGSILTVEARHQAVVSEFQGQSGFPSPFDTPLDFSEVYSLAAPFVTSLPKNAAVLPVVAFPSLVIKTPSPVPGKPIGFHWAGKSMPKFYAHFLNGLTDTAVELSKHNTCDVPAGLTGRVYVVITTSETLSDQTTVAGPAIIDISDPDTKSFRRVRRQ